MKVEAEAAVETAKGVLQDLVVVVSLVRTLTDSFGSASDLYRRLKRRSEPKTEEGGQYPEPAQPDLGRRDSACDHDRPRRRSVRWNMDHLMESKYVDSEEEIIRKSSYQIRAEYERGYRHLGESFARGDSVIQIQLQSQIIHLHQTLIDIHQDLLLSTYVTPESNHSHLARLVQTTRNARSASIQALNLQYQRLLPRKSPNSAGKMPGAFPAPPYGPHDSYYDECGPKHRRDSCLSSSSSDSASEVVKILPIPKPKPEPEPEPKSVSNPLPRPRPPPARKSPKLFCTYATDLQRNPGLPLANSYRIGGNGICPFCRSHIATTPSKAWEIITDSHRWFNGRVRLVSRTFLVANRFVIKSHREGGGFACVLCARFRKSDTVCRQIGALMEHLWRDHSSEEMEQDEDVMEC